jgi:signal transduction histidine kinase
MADCQIAVFLTMRFVFVCIAVCISRLLPAQHSFQAYTPVNGLVDARVQTIHQDRNGVLYFLTRDGFSSFDGQRFVNFTQAGDVPVSVTNNMLQMQDGSLLLSAITGIYHFKNNLLVKDTGMFKQVIEPGDFIPLTGGQFLLPANSGLYFFDGNKLQQLDAGPLNTAKGLFSIDKAIAYGHFIAMMADGKLLLYNWHTQKVTDVFSSSTVRNILQFNGISFVDTEKGWQQLNAAAWGQGKLVTEPLYFQPQLPVGFRYSHFYIDAGKNIWLISAADGLCCMSAATGKSVFYNYAAGLPAGVGNVYCDAEGNTWMIVYGKAVYKMVQSRVAPFVFNKQPHAISLCGSNEALLLGKKDSLFTFTPQGQQLVKMKTPPGSMRAFYWNGDWWHLLPDAMLISAGGKRISLRRTLEGPFSLSAKISFDKENRLLIAGSYCNIIDRNHRQWSVRLPYFTDKVVADDSNHYWGFSRGGHIFKFGIQGDSIQQLALFSGLRYGTREVLHWNADTFCIGTRSAGLVVLSVNPAGYRYLSVMGRSRGLSNNFVVGLSKAGSHSLLAATVTGLDMFYFYPADTTVEQLYSRINVFTGANYLARLNDSTILALNEDLAVYQVNTSPTQNTGYIPRLFFNQVRVNGEVADTGSNVSFAYNKNNLRFSVSAPSFIDEKNIRFIFRLSGEGLEKEQEGVSADFEISNLLPGRYRLQVTASFPGYQYAAQSVQYTFTIRKPFWKTAGFITAAAILLLLGAYFFFRSVLRRRLLQQRIRLEKEKAIAGERTRIATDMHDDLGAGISTIKYLSQSAPFIAPEVQKENNLKIAAQADELVDKMNDIIWAMNESNDLLDNLIYYCKAWVVSWCDMHQLPVKVNVPATIPPVTVRGDVRQHIFLCIKEAVHNVVKHAGATAMELSFIPGSGKLNIIVSDNGKGFDREKIKPGNGLYNMQKRMQQVKGNLEVESANGTRLHFSVPL